MKKHIIKALVAITLVASITGTKVLADDVNTYKQEQEKEQAKLDNLENELAYLLIEMDNLEIKMAEINDNLIQITDELEAAQVLQTQQYQDMKLRIRYMYEDQSTTMMEAVLSSENMSDMLNKAEYMQQVYEYDRSKLAEMAETSQLIKDKKTEIETQKASLETAQKELTSKQATLYTTIAEQESVVSDIGTKVANAQKAAAQAIAAQSSNNTVTSGNGDASIGQGIANMAYNYIGVPYASGGSSPSGFDCSGFTAFLYRQYGISLSRTSSSQAYGGVYVAGLSQALPGDIICYPGHVAIYVGGGQIIHATVPGSTVKLTSATGIGKGITAIRRYW